MSNLPFVDKSRSTSALYVARSSLQLLRAETTVSTSQSYIFKQPRLNTSPKVAISLWSRQGPTVMKQKLNLTLKFLDTIRAIPCREVIVVGNKQTPTRKRCLGSPQDVT
jgi:hypothetical protein